MASCVINFVKLVVVLFMLATFAGTWYYAACTNNFVKDELLIAAKAIKPDETPDKVWIARLKLGRILTWSSAVVTSLVALIAVVGVLKEKLCIIIPIGGCFQQLKSLVHLLALPN